MESLQQRWMGAGHIRAAPRSLLEQPLRAENTIVHGRYEKTGFSLPLCLIANSLTGADFERPVGCAPPSRTQAADVHPPVSWITCFRLQAGRIWGVVQCIGR